MYDLFMDLEDLNQYILEERKNEKINGTESILVPLTETLSFFEKKNGELDMCHVLKDFAADEMILFAKFYVNFKNTFVSGPYSMLDAYLLYAGMGLVDPRFAK